MDGREVGCGEPIVSGCGAPEVFQPAEHPFDRAPAAIERGTEAALPTTVRLGRDIRYRAAASIARRNRSASKARSAMTNAPSRMVSISVSPPRRSAVLPPERWNAIGLPLWLAAAWIFVVHPPRERPMAYARSPLSPGRAAVRLGVGRIEHHLGGRTAGRRERLEDAPPDALDRPANVAVVQRLRWTVLAWCMPPGATRAQHLHDPTDQTSVVHTWLAACVACGRPAVSRRQQRRKTPHLRLAQPKQIAHPGSLHRSQGYRPESHRHASLKELYGSEP